MSEEQLDYIYAFSKFKKCESSVLDTQTASHLTWYNYELIFNLGVWCLELYFWCNCLLYHKPSYLVVWGIILLLWHLQNYLVMFCAIRTDISRKLKLVLNWWKGKPSGSIACKKKQQPRLYWSCSSVAMNDATPLTPPSAWAELHFQM